MGHKEVSGEQRQALTERARAQKEALGEKNVLGWIRRKERELRVIQHTQLAALAPWPGFVSTLLTFAGSLHRPGLPGQKEARTATAVAWGLLLPPVAQLGRCPCE